MSLSTVNQSEEFVLRVCQSSFLSLWCYHNPRGKPGKELCDILVVFGDYLIIISVKEIALKDSGNPSVDCDRWERAALDKSIKQIYGAERWLRQSHQVIRHDGSPGLLLPEISNRRIHRIAIAFGGQGKTSIRSGDLGKGYINVLTEDSFLTILNELDTISDFVKYLDAKAAKNCALIMLGSEADLVGWFVYNGRCFPPKADMILVEDGIWESIQKNTDFQERKNADKESYVWDKMIEHMAANDGGGFSDPADTLSNLEFSLRAMAQENRFSRRFLGRGARQFLEQTKVGRLRSRVMASDLTSTAYVLVYFGNQEDTERRHAELVNRCYVVRNNLPHARIVVGIGICKHVPEIGQPFDLVYCDWTNWSKKEAKVASEIQELAGYYTIGEIHQSSEDEFPKRQDDATRTSGRVDKCEGPQPRHASRRTKRSRNRKRN